jgi:hypothetical protein
MIDMSRLVHRPIYVQMHDDKPVAFSDGDVTHQIDRIRTGGWKQGSGGAKKSHEPFTKSLLLMDTCTILSNTVMIGSYIGYGIDGILWRKVDKHGFKNDQVTIN